MDSLGTRLIGALICEKDASALAEHRIDGADLLDESKKAYLWVLDYVKTHGDWPSKKIVEENCGVDLPDAPDPLDYICDQVRKRSLAKTLELDLRQAAEKLESRDPDEAMRLISEAAHTHRKKLITKSSVVSFRESGTKRIETYEALKSFGGYEGVATPWPRLDSAIQGWVNGTFNVVTAMQNTGKTWFLGVCANHALSLGKKVGFVSLEMTTSRIARRVDAIKYKIPFRHLRDGDMNEKLESEWKEKVERDTEGLGDILFADKQLIRTVDDATSFVLEHKPDIIFIDGGYRFQTAGRSNWEQQVDIVRGLQLSAEATKIPWVVSTQQGDASESGRESKRGPHMRAWGVRYGKEWVIDPDVVIGLYANEDLRLTKELEIHLLKMRDTAGDIVNEMKIRWDTIAMNFDELTADAAPHEAAESKISVPF